MTQDTSTVGSPQQALRLLQQQKISFTQCTADAQVNEAQRVIVILLEDEQQSLAVMLPRNRILDLRLLDAQLDANLLHDESGTQRLKLKLSVDELPAISQLLDRPTIVDSELLKQPRLFIESGQSGLLLQISQADFAQQLHSAQFMRLSQEIPHEQPNLLPSSLEQGGNREGVYSLTAMRIKQTLETTVEIPPLSNTAQKVLKLRTDPNACIDELTGIIETDPAMAAQVMSWASSPYYATPGKVRSIEDAIVRVLGFDLVINLALGLALGKSLQLPQNSNANRNYWQAAIYTAALIEGLAHRIPRQLKPEVGLAYLAGLLHSFGYALLAHLFPGYFHLVNQYLAANPHLPSHQVEYFLLGITREQIGAWLMQHWKMPAELTVAIRQQHNAEFQGEHASYALLTFLANQLLTRQENIPAQVYQRLGLTAEQAQQALEHVLAAEKALRSLADQFST